MSAPPDPAGAVPLSHGDGAGAIPTEIVPIRHWGRWVAAVVVLALVAAFVNALAHGQIVWSVIPDAFRSDIILTGLRNTIVLSVLAQAVGIVLGVLFAVLRLSRNPVTAAVSWFYIWFFRGTPVLVQIVIWFNLALAFKYISIPVPFTHDYLFRESTVAFISPFVAALLGLGLNEGAYMAEIVRAGIISVDPGQTEAAQALGMTSGQTMRRIVLPQAMRVIIPPTGNEFINMLKTSSLATIATYSELFNTAQRIYSRTLDNVELLFTISLWYLILTSVASVGQYYIERRFARGAARALPETPLQRVLRNLRPGRRATR